MSCLTRQSFVKSVGLGAGVASLAPVASALGTGEVSIVPVPQTPSSKNELRFRQVHLDFHTRPVSCQNRVRLKLNQIPPIPQLRATLPRSLVPVLFPMIRVWRCKFAHDQTGNGFAEKFFQAALHHVYRWCSPPTRGMSTT